MARFASWSLAFMFSILTMAVRPCSAADAPKTYGWRGNWTGLYPDADPPTTWRKIQKGVVAGTTCQAAKPAEGDKPSGQRLVDAMIRDWLVIGPFEVRDPVADFTKEAIPGEANLAPAEGDKVGDLAWKRLEIKKKPNYQRWGQVDLEWVDLIEPLGYKPSSFAYAHTYLHATRPGKVTFVVDHYIGLKVWLNGEVVYASPKEASGYGSHYGISRQKLGLVHGHSPKFEMSLKEGWNRLLVRVGSPQMHLKEWRQQKFTHCLFDSEPVYETKNIVWEAKMPERTNACPIVVGDRIFTPAEPDELLCLDKATGKILWRRTNSFFDAIPEAERAANPALKELEPIAKAIAETDDYDQGLELRRKVRDGLLADDKKAYKLKLEGHLEGHFGIVGFTTTPTSDGKNVYAYYGYGVLACYDFDGNRKWIRRLTTPNEISYSCSPALIGGKVVVIFNGMYALDAETGAVAWTDPKEGSIASLLPARIRGTDVVSTQRGKIHRASDGKLLWANPHIIPNDTGWAPGVFLGDTLYLNWYGMSQLLVEDFSEAAGDEWKPKERTLGVGVNNKSPEGKWQDRFTPASPLILGDTFYGIDQMGTCYALDLKSGKPLYRQDSVGFDELHTYNAIGVGASPALGGKHIYVIDNQGECVVYEPGPVFRQVAFNRIETVVDRAWPWSPQEIVANGPLVFDGKRIYIRGEQYLYCIGEK